MPIVFMGYYNPFLNYGERKLMIDCKKAGVDGFIIVDLPPEEAIKFRDLTAEFSLSYIPLITPTTTESRIKRLVSIASSFIYVVSVSGVTGARDAVSSDLPQLVKRIKQFTNVPLAVGFGVANREHFLNVAAHSEGVVIGSKIITVLKNSAPGNRGNAVREFAQSITERTNVTYIENAASQLGNITISDSLNVSNETITNQIKSSNHLMESRFGEFGGQYAPEALVDCLDEIEKVKF